MDEATEKKRARDVLAELAEKYGENELTDLARVSGVPRPTLDYWKKHPDSIVRLSARKHLKNAEQPLPDLAQIHRDLVEVRDLLRSFLTLDREGRAGETVKAKSKRQGGGAA